MLQRPSRRRSYEDADLTRQRVEIAARDILGQPLPSEMDKASHSPLSPQLQLVGSWMHYARQLVQLLWIIYRLGREDHPQTHMAHAVSHLGLIHAKSILKPH